jgi:hexosaminidase
MVVASQFAVCSKQFALRIEHCSLHYPPRFASSLNRVRAPSSPIWIAAKGKVKTVFLFATLLFFSSLLTAQTNLIPKTKGMHILGDTVLVPQTLSIASAPIFKAAGDLLSHYATSEFGLRITPQNKPTGDFVVVFTQVPNQGQSPEAYQLTIAPGGFWVEATTDQGALRAVQTIRQLLHMAPQLNGQRVLSAITFTDEPAFAHRGLLLDVCRHYFSVETVKKYIDLLALYKMNTLHWHLTEDQGWRIHLDKYPKLTEVGAWRTEKDSSRYGGYYTKEQIREVVAYATARGITVIPEIEMPGHSQAALAAYPHLSCTGDSTIAVANDWGVFKEIYCAGNDTVFTFLEDVLTEVMQLFPAKYIHIGGDEAPKYRWEHCPKCQKRMASEGLKNEHELQSYFIKRIEEFLNQNGRQLIGWDEILEGGLSPNATVQSWRGMQHGLVAARDSHYVVMSPTSHCYLDYNLHSINLEKVYSFNPIPQGLEKTFEPYILGAEVNMWTEHVPNDSVLDSRVFPRLMAMAEVLWSGPGGNYQGFFQRVQEHYPILQKKGVRYGLEAEPITVKSVFQDGQMKLAIAPGSPNLYIEYGYDAGPAMPYTAPLPIVQSGMLHLTAFKQNKVYGKPLSLPLTCHAALGKMPAYVHPYSTYYTGGGNYALVDGLTGSLDFRDGHWQGFSGHNLEVMLDLGKEQAASTIRINFYQYGNAWILPPEWVAVFTSTDNITWDEWGSQPFELPRDGALKKIVAAVFTPAGVRPVRYVKVVAKNHSHLPEWHEAAGSEAWLFVDEIEVR